MQLRTFSASTMAEALVCVKNELGGDAVILHTRTYNRRRWLGLKRVEVVEITASQGLKVSRASTRTRDRAPNSNGNASRDDVRRDDTRQNDPRNNSRDYPASRDHRNYPRDYSPTANGNSSQRESTANTNGNRDSVRAMDQTNQDIAAQYERARSIVSSLQQGSNRAQLLQTPIGSPTSSAHRHLLETPAANAAAVLHLTQEMATLKSMLNELVTQTRQNQVPDVHEDLLSYYTQMIQSQVASELAMDILSAVCSGARSEQLKNPHYVNEKICEQLEKMLPVTGPIMRKKTFGPHIVALVGPTGVGKTTSIAKLAANLKLRENSSVGLITIDTFRIAAVDQLKKYADILDIPLRVVASPEDLKEAIKAMSSLQFVLIDTAGRSPSDTLKLHELRNFINVAAPDEVHLVLSSNTSQECIESAVAKFNSVGADRILFTKLDEAVHVGVLLNVVRKVNKALSYVTTGQDVPKDIEVSRGRRIAQLIMTGGNV